MVEGSRSEILASEKWQNFRDAVSKTLENNLKKVGQDAENNNLNGFARTALIKLLKKPGCIKLLKEDWVVTNKEQEPTKLLPKILTNDFVQVIEGLEQKLDAVQIISNNEFAAALSAALISAGYKEKKEGTLLAVVNDLLCETDENEHITEMQDRKSDDNASLKSVVQGIINSSREGLDLQKELDRLQFLAKIKARLAVQFTKEKSPLYNQLNSLNKGYMLKEHKKDAILQHIFETLKSIIKECKPSDKIFRMDAPKFADEIMYDTNQVMPNFKSMCNMIGIKNIQIADFEKYLKERKQATNQTPSATETADDLTVEGPREELVVDKAGSGTKVQLKSSGGGEVPKNQEDDKRRLESSSFTILGFDWKTLFATIALIAAASYGISYCINSGVGQSLMNLVKEYAEPALHYIGIV